MQPKHALLPLAALLLAGCFPESDNQDSNNKDDDNTTETTTQLNEQILDTNRLGVIATASSDYQTSDIAVFGTDAQLNVTVKEGGFATTDLTDIGISTFDNELYREGRYQANNLTKYSLNNDLTADLDWQYSVLGDDSSANPYSLTFTSASQAYMTRYDSTDLWVINPSVSNSGSSDFFQDVIDLSAYAHAEAGGTPRMNDALLVDDKLYVLMERLDSDYSAVEYSYLAVIDTTSNSEIDTTPDDPKDLKGIALPIKNARNLSFHDGTIYISGRGDTTFGASEAAKYTGGIATVSTESTENYSTDLLVDDGDETSNEYGQFQLVEVIDSDHGYFVGRKGWGNDTLYHFNPSNPVSFTPVDGLSGINIADIASLKLNDSEARFKSVLYVAVQAGSAEEAGRINVVNVPDQTVFASFDLLFNPTDIEFMDR